MKKFYFVFWTVLLLFLTNSCNLDSLDFNKLSKEMSLNPEVVAPVAKANITVWDLLQSVNQTNSDVIIKDPTSGLVKIVYTQNDLFKYNVRDFLNFPNQQNFSSGDKQLGEISPADISATRNITLSELASSLGGNLEVLKTFNGMTVPFPAYSFNGPSVQYGIVPITDYTSITLSKGTLDISLENKMKVPFTLKGSLFDIGYNKVIADFTFTNILPNGTSKTSVSLVGIKLSNTVEFRLLSFETIGSAIAVPININDFFKMTFDLKNLSISSGNLKVTPQTLEGSSSAFGFEFPEPDFKAFGAVLKKGSLTIKTNNTSKLTGTFNFTLNEIKQNGVPIKTAIPLTGNSTTIDLSGAVINFSFDPLKPFNQVPYSYTIQLEKSNGYVNYASTDVVKIDITLVNMEFKSVTGDFGKRVIKIGPDVFDMNVDLLNKIEGSFKLANPQLELIIHNSIGTPASANLNFTASNKDGKTASLNPPVFDIPVPANINAGISTKSIFFDKQNSNIVNFIALPPTSQISYSGQVDFNTMVPVTQANPNFLDIDATFAIDLTMELPMELQISNLAFKDTSSISGGDFDKLETADLILNAKNGIPLDVEIQLFFIDSSKKQIGTSKKTKILSAAQVDASGTVTPVQSSNTFSLDKTEMDNLRKSSEIVFTGTVSSPSGGTGVAKIMADSKIELNVVIKAKANL